VEAAVAAMRQGAADFLEHPLPKHELVAAVERALESSRWNATPFMSHDSDSRFPLLAHSKVMLDLFQVIREKGSAEGPVLIVGEPGTGKELVAHAVHASSKRQHAPMITLNCTSIPTKLIDTELFGHEPGSTLSNTSMRRGLLQAADGGTLFLDEIGELPLEAQARLVSVLQSGEYRGIGTTHRYRVDVRLIASSHRNLSNMVETGGFRSDLLHRLGEITLELPPLRERPEDIPLLAEHLLQKISHELNRPRRVFAPEVLAAMADYPWPGNVRELKNAIERAVILSDEEEIPVSLLAIQTFTEHAQNPTGADTAGPSQNSLEEYFVQFVQDHQEELTETELAQRLGISRKSLWERRQRLNIPRKKTRRKMPRRNQHSLK